MPKEMENEQNQINHNFNQQQNPQVQQQSPNNMQQPQIQYYAVPVQQRTNPWVWVLLTIAIVVPLCFLIYFFVLNERPSSQPATPEQTVAQEQSVPVQNQPVVQERVVVKEVPVPTNAPRQEAVSGYGPYHWLASRLVQNSDLYGMSNGELRIMRNYIYAMHGYKFKDKALANYFSQFTWYSPMYSDVNSFMNKTEKQNVERIKSYEKYGSVN